jgi:hypothetical protein
MNIIFIIGNGFDLRLGLPTGYPDFLNHYKKQNPKHNIEVKTSKEEFFKFIGLVENEEWKDLEVSLGNFTSHLTDKTRFLEFYRDINLSLVDYLSDIEEEANSTFTDEQSEHLKQSLLTPYNYLNNREKELFKNHLGGNLYASIISLNYTSFLETLCKGHIEIGKYYDIPDSPRVFRLNQIKHIHGRLTEKSILLGVDNEEQISNKDFRLDEDILDVMIKPRGNENIGSLIDRECQDLIKEADVIYIFGSSLGETDKMWWTAIKERFSNSQAIILYFVHDKNAISTLSTEMSFKRSARQQLIRALGLEGDEANYRDRIFIALNTAMFPEKKQ